MHGCHSRFAGHALVALVTAAAAAQDDAGALVAELGGERGASASARLVALGEAAVPALVAALRAEDRPALGEVLAVLRELGPAGAGATAALRDAVARVPRELVPTAVATLAEVAPFCAPEDRLDHDAVSEALWQAWDGPRPTGRASDMHVEMARLRCRLEFPLDLDVDALTRAASGHQPFRAELAIQQLGMLGQAARGSVDALLEVTARPDPRVLPTDRTIPLRATAARALLAIDADGDAAAVARAVLDGSATISTDRRELPARLRDRIAELLAELDDETTAAAAATNLVALGAPVAVPVAESLRRRHDSRYRRAALDVLHDLGPRGAAAVPVLVDLLTALPVESTLDVVRALRTTAPWSRDFVPTVGWRVSMERATLWGVRLAGEPDPAWMARFAPEVAAYRAAMRVHPSSTLAELEELLASPVLATRAAALRVLRERRDAARTVLPAITAVMDSQQPTQHSPTWDDDGGLTVGRLDRTAEVQRLAAQAILAIAARDDPLVERAERVLRREAR